MLVNIAKTWQYCIKCLDSKIDICTMLSNVNAKSMLPMGEISSDQSIMILEALPLSNILL